MKMIEFNHILSAISISENFLMTSQLHDTITEFSQEMRRLKINWRFFERNLYKQTVYVDNTLNNIPWKCGIYSVWISVFCQKLPNMLQEEVYQRLHIITEVFSVPPPQCMRLFQKLYLSTPDKFATLRTSTPPTSFCDASKST